METLQFQRIKQQGLGRPIISEVSNGMRFVAIGARVAWGKWTTFQDFLLWYLKHSFGLHWGEAELQLPEQDRHPLFGWLTALDTLIRRHTTDPEGINEMPNYGAAMAVFSLAYDLYLIEHHANTDSDKRAFARILSRMRHSDQFFGARHEARAAGIMLRAGFDVRWEEERAGKTGGHAEFVATFPSTGRSFWVECKMRQPTSDKSPPSFAHLLSAALKKKTNLERLIFVEMNAANASMDRINGGWVGWALNHLRTFELQPKAAELSSALVFISNFAEHLKLYEVLEGSATVGVALEGFKDSRYRTGEIMDLREAINRRESDLEIERLWQSLEQHTRIPVTFDGGLPSIDEGNRLLIGRSYQLPSGEVGVLEEATVVEQEECAAAILRLADEQRIMVKFPLSQQELSAWNSHPETFFGELRSHHREAKSAMDMFDFFMSGYRTTPRETLLNLMAAATDIDRLRGMSQPELAKEYAYRLTVAAVSGSRGFDPPVWHHRLRGRKTK
ncbi:MAG TPA: hypothetical protein VGU65_13445 [Frateuria sp.]|uniref:hypothetical protein n=1 Tax=Frateuria sp. TaxID=2211372 RepID=UPI002DEAD582|nr:hypothetical protein [Frateuria sp.]